MADYFTLLRDRVTSLEDSPRPGFSATPPAIQPLI